MTPKIALSIAGSDPSGGAGIQADLKTFSALGVYGAAALAGLTVQSTQGVRAAVPVDPSFVRDQVVAVIDDLPVAATKLGMLSNAEVAGVVADLLEERRDDFGFLVRLAFGVDAEQAQAVVGQEQLHQQGHALEQLHISADEPLGAASLAQAQHQQQQADHAAADEGDQRQRHRPAPRQQQVAHETPREVNLLQFPSAVDKVENAVVHLCSHNGRLSQ